MKTLARAVVWALCFLGAARGQSQNPTPTPVEIDTHAPSRLSQAPQATPTPTPDPPAADCKKFRVYPEYPGCKSFNELLAAKDKDVLALLTGPNRGYVCFRTDEDAFTIVSFEKLGPYGFKKVAGSFWVEQTGSAFVETFEQGQSTNFQTFGGKWKKFGEASVDAANFLGGGIERLPPGQRNSSININESEISVSYQWRNVSNTMTTYTLQIRRSTERGLETLEAPPPPTKKDRTTLHIRHETFCEYYPNQ